MSGLNDVRRRVVGSVGSPSRRQLLNLTRHHPVGKPLPPQVGIPAFRRLLKPAQQLVARVRTMLLLINTDKPLFRSCRLVRLELWLRRRRRTAQVAADDDRPAAPATPNPELLASDAFVRDLIFGLTAFANHPHHFDPFSTTQSHDPVTR